jgi:hypothetical protein
MTVLKMSCLKKQIDRLTKRDMDIQIGGQTERDRYTDKWTDRQTDRHIDRDKWTDR